jgi:hypothetical protein
MSSATPAAPPDPPPDATAEEIEADIQASRDRLASSVDALTSKLDVKAQAKQKARETSERVRAGAQHAYEQTYERARTTSPRVLGAVAAGVVGLVVLLIALRRRVLPPKLSPGGPPRHLSLPNPFSRSMQLQTGGLRAHLHQQPRPPAAEGPSLMLRALTSRRCHVNGYHLALQAQGVRCARRSRCSPGAAVSREHLMSRVWDESW